MTIKEATKLLKMSDQAIWLKGLEKERKEAEDMAIKSLEAWEKVKEEINNIDCPYSSNPYKASKVKEEALRIIDKHLKEVEHGSHSM